MRGHLIAEASYLRATSKEVSQICKGLSDNVRNA
jgi:hypothetical protein